MREYGFTGLGGNYMNTIFEILGREPIENIITCLNFKLDRVIYWGYPNDIKYYRENLTNYLKKECGVSQVEFKELPVNNLKGILSIRCFRSSGVQIIMIMKSWSANI